MNDGNFCRLTTKDHAILETIQDRSRETCPHYAALLARKLGASAIHLRDDIPADVATLNSRIVYSSDGVACGPRLLVQSDFEGMPDFALSIHDLAGLALLGLSEGDAISFATPKGSRTIVLEAVMHQPEAAHNGPRVQRWTDVETTRPTVVAFQPRRSFVPAPNGDDPGPQAA